MSEPIVHVYDPAHADRVRQGYGWQGFASWTRLKAELEAACGLKAGERLVGLRVDERGVTFCLAYRERPADVDA